MREEDNVMREEDNVAEVTNESTERPTKTARRKFLESAGAAAGALTASGLLIGPELVSGQKRNLPPRQLEGAERPVTELIQPNLHQNLTPTMRRVTRQQLAELAGGGPNAPKNITLNDIKSFVDTLVTQHGGTTRIRPDFTLGCWGFTLPSPTPTPSSGGGGWAGSCCCCAASVAEPVRGLHRLA